MKMISIKKNPIIWIGFFSSLIIGVILYSFIIGRNMATRFSPLVDASMEIKLEGAIAHLWFEEIISGDRTVQLESIWEHIDQSRWYAEAMLKGGENSEGTYIPLTDPVLRQQIYKTIEAIDAFRTIAEERWNARAQSGIGSVIDQRFDSVFEQFMSSADAVETALQLEMKRQVGRYKFLQLMLLIFIIIIGIILGFLFVHNEKQRQVFVKELEEKEEDIRTTLLSIGDGVIATDVSGRVTRMNPIAEKLTGWSFETAKGRLLTEVFQIVNAYSGAVVENSVDKVMRHGGIVGLANHTTLIAKDGAKHQIADSAAPIYNGEAGEISGVVLVFRDVTEKDLMKQALGESEIRTDALLSAIPDLMFRLNNEGTFLYYKADTPDLYIQDSEQIIGKKYRDIFSSEFANIIDGKVAMALDTGVMQTFEYHLPIPKKGVQDFEARMARSGKNEITTIVRNISERKTNEKNLLESDALKSAVIDNSPIGISVRDARGTLLLANKAWRDIWNIDRKQFTSRTETRSKLSFNQRDNYLGKHLPEVKKVYESGGEYYIPEIQPLIPAPGKAEWISQFFYAIMDNNNQVEKVVILTEDISQRMKAIEREQVLGKLAHRLNSSTNIHSVGQKAAELVRSYFKSDAFAIEYFDHEAEIVFGVYSEDTLTDKGIPEELPTKNIPFSKAEPGFIEANSVAHVINRTPEELNNVDIPTFGSGRLSHSLLFAPILWEKELIGIFRVQSYSDNLYSESDLPTVQTFANQIASALKRAVQQDELKRNQIELQNSEQQFRAFTNQSVEGITVADVDGNYTFVNPTFCNMIGYSHEELLGMTVFDVKAPEQDKNAFAMSKKSHEGLPIEVLLQRKDGSTFVAEVVGKMIEIGDKQSVLGIVRDVTEQQKEAEERTALENQLRQSQKLEAVGTMVGGVAHDFNNILQSMFLYGEIVSEKLPEDEELRANFQHILDGGDRARNLVQQILTFSRKSAIDLKPQTIHEIILDALTFERASSPPNIEIIQKIDMNCGYVLCDETQIHQIIINLCNNGKQAMGENGGVLNVSLTTTIAPNLEGADTQYLEIMVTDTGTGMDLETVAKIFDPFFTTKAVGEGTGLGLSVIHGIVELMNGQIKVSSEPGEGTSFQILLPQVSIHAPEEPRSIVTPQKSKGAKALLVDDEESILLAGKAVLERRGYRVDIANDGDMALEKFNANPNLYDVIITDLSMLRMSGIELARSIRKLGSKVPIVLSSGNLEGDEKSRFKKKGISVFLHKPWSADQLIECIEELLNSRN